MPNAHRAVAAQTVEIFDAVGVGYQAIARERFTRIEADELEQIGQRRAAISGKIFDDLRVGKRGVCHRSSTRCVQFDYNKRLQRRTQTICTTWVHR